MYTVCILIIKILRVSYSPTESYRVDTWVGGGKQDGSYTFFIPCAPYKLECLK